MRITENSIYKGIKDSVNKPRSNLAKLQQEAGGLKRINKPSDDPAGYQHVTQIKESAMNNEQFVRNASLAKNFLYYTETVLTSALDVVDRTKDLSIQMASNAANGAETRSLVAEEVNSLRQELLSLANKRLGGRYIFGGFQTSTKPFSERGDYSGDDGNMMVEVDEDVFVSMNLPGQDVFSGSPVYRGEFGLEQDEPENAFFILNTFYDALKSNDHEKIQSVLGSLDGIRSRLIEARTDVGTKASTIENSIRGIGERDLIQAEVRSSMEDADLVRVVADLAKEETALKASLGAAQKFNSLKLLDFLT